MLALMQGREHDRVPFIQYDNMVPNVEAWALVGRENLGLARWTGIHQFDAPNCSYKTEEITRDGRRGFRAVLHTPEGDLVEERLIEPTYGTSAALTHFVKEPQDYRRLLAYLRDITVRKDLDEFWAAWKELGDDGLPHINVGRTPYQQLWIQWVGADDLAWHMVEHTELMEEVITEMERVQRDVYKVICEAASEAPINSWARGTSASSYSLTWRPLFSNS
jgi:hypothetical protein